MKRILLLFVICLFVQSVSVAQEGVDFRNISLEEALEQAKAEDKLGIVYRMCGIILLSPPRAAPQIRRRSCAILS